MKYFDPNIQDVVYEDALENRFDDLLDEMYSVLRRTDPVAYREAFMQWLGGEIGSQWLGGEIGSGELEEPPGS